MRHKIKANRLRDSHRKRATSNDIEHVTCNRLQNRLSRESTNLKNISSQCQKQQVLKSIFVRCGISKLVVLKLALVSTVRNGNSLLHSQTATLFMSPLVSCSHRQMAKLKTGFKCWENFLRMFSTERKTCYLLWLHTELPNWTVVYHPLSCYRVTSYIWCFLCAQTKKQNMRERSWIKRSGFWN